jgi:LAO/AO transport system ATPase
MTVMPELLKLRTELGIEHIPLVLGGIVPVEDHPKLIEMGVAAVFNPGSPINDIIAKVNELTTTHPSPHKDELLAGYEQGDQRALAKIISTVQRGEGLGGWSPPKGNATIIGVTGAPGVGKSSFIAKLGHKLRERGKRVAVVAIDPSSPVSGGALLGDRLRMMTGKPDRDFFVRSLASGEVQGGLGPRAEEVVAILSGFGFDYVIVETVGAGQADVAIRRLTDHVLLLLMPEAGDAIQFSKAGIMEIAGSFVINKCDLPGADATEAQLLGVLGKDRPIWKVSSMRNEGFDQVADAIAAM